jgi:hypothetical protein
VTLKDTGEKLDAATYLKGVLPAEMPAEWPIEALKTQCVAAASYGASKSWLLFSDTRDQAFLPARRTAKTDGIVDAMAGILAYHGGAPARLFYSASCGGHTLDDWAPAYLRATECPCGREVSGHQHGLCQWGARELAERGLSWRAILDWYYHDIEIRSNWGEEVAMKGSTFGVHFQTPPELNSEPTEMIRKSAMRVIKGIDPDAWPSTPRELFPKQRVLARLWRGRDAQDHELMRKGAAGADEYWLDVGPRFLRLAEGGCLDWLGPNEPHPSLEPDGPAAMEAFWVRLVELMAAAGGRPWAWSFGVGWPDRECAKDHLGSIAAAIRAGGGLEVHEYGCPSVMDGDGWWTLRIRRTIAELYAAGLPPAEDWVIVGECGITWGLLKNQPDKGWQSRPSWVYPAQFGLPQGGMTEERFWRQMAWLDDEYRKLPEILAMTPFVTNPNSDWSTFDWGSALIARSIVKLAASSGIGVEEELAERMQAQLIPQNPGAAFYTYGRARGWEPISVERDETVAGIAYRCQSWFTPATMMQHLVFCEVGNWGAIRHTDRAN